MYCVCTHPPELTWSTGVIDLLQQRQALVLRPVMNDSGQNVKVCVRNVTTEEIT